MTRGNGQGKTLQNDAEISARTLTPEQDACLMALLAGATDADAALAAGVSRASVTRWRNDPLFVATLNSEQQALWDAHRLQLETLQGRALAVIGKALDSPDEAISFKAAVSVLRLAGERPSGPTSVLAVQLEAAIF